MALDFLSFPLSSPATAGPGLPDSVTLIDFPVFFEQEDLGHVVLSPLSLPGGVACNGFPPLESGPLSDERRLLVHNNRGSN